MSKRLIEEQYVKDADEAGFCIREILNNSTVLVTPEDGALMVIAKIGHLLKNADVYYALIEGAGFKCVRTLGGWELAKR